MLTKIILPKIGATKVRAVRAADLDGLYADLQRPSRARAGLNPQSVAHVHALIRRLLNQAVRWGWIVANPATRASPPRVHKHELHLPSPEAVVNLMAEADRRDPDFACFLRLAATTGARRGELCAVRWRDVDLDAATLSIRRSIVGTRNDNLVEKGTKTHASRRVSLDQGTVASLTAFRAACSERAAIFDTAISDDAYVFSNGPDGGAPWRPNGVTLAFGRLCRTCGVDNVRLHDLRHFAATQMLTAGVPIKTVAGRLGHANAATTLNVYAHFLESSDQAAAQVLGDLLGSHSSKG